MANREWVLDGRDESARRVLEGLVRVTIGNAHERQVVRDGARFLLNVRSPRWLHALKSPNEARERAQALVDAIVGITKLVEAGPIEVELGNSIRIAGDD